MGKKERQSPAAHVTPSGGSQRGFPQWLAYTPIVPLLAVLAYSAGDEFQHGSSFWSVLGTGSMVAFAALIVGGLIGFLFALPRTRERSDTDALLRTNTNLEEVSDWLTKILVGLGLVQLGKVAGGVGSLAAALAPGLGGKPDARALAVGLLVYSAVDGVLVGYLYTRIIISNHLRQAAEHLADGVARARVFAKDLPPEAPALPPAPSGSASPATGQDEQENPDQSSSEPHSGAE